MAIYIWLHCYNLTLLIVAYTNGLKKFYLMIRIHLNIRKVVKRDVERMMICKTPYLSFSIYTCPHCDNMIKVFIYHEHIKFSCFKYALKTISSKVSSCFISDLIT